MPAPRTLPLAIVACGCGEFVVSLLHPVPRCEPCDRTPSYVRDTFWELEI
jgi:hypothetical protein